MNKNFVTRYLKVDDDEEDAIGLFDVSAFEAHLTRGRKDKIGAVKNYKMDHPKRGKAIIFNHESFAHPLYSTRHGTEEDVKNLQGTLLKLGFQEEDITVYNDLPFLEVINVLKTVSSDDHSDNDLLMVFVLTHGFNNDRIMAYDEPYPVEQIWSYFTAEKCPTLAEKPKIFFVVACRGDIIDRGYRISNLEQQSSIQVDAMAIPTNSSYVIPIWSDFLCVFSSYKGYYSYRNTGRGTWFVQAFCEQASKTNFNKVSFTDFLTGVNGHLARTFQTGPFDLRKQTPVLSSTLTRLLYLKNKSS